MKHSKYYLRYLILWLSTAIIATASQPSSPPETALSPSETQNVETSSFYETVSTPTPPVLLTKPFWKRFIGAGYKANYPQLKITATANQLLIIKGMYHLLSLNAQTGKRNWQIKTNYPLSAPLAVDNNRLLFVLTTEPRLSVLSVGSGKLLWSIALPHIVTAKPLIDSERILLKTLTGEVLALDKNKGELLWRYQHPLSLNFMLHTSSAPQLDEDQVLIGFPDGNLVALDKQRGILRWTAALTTERSSSTIPEALMDIATDPLVVNKTIYVATYQGSLSARNRLTGEPYWQRDFSSTTGLAWGTYLYASDDTGTIWAFHPHTGEPVWQKTLSQGQLVTQPVIQDDSLVVSDTQGITYWLSQETGQVLTKTKPPVKSPILTSPIVQDNQVYTAHIWGEIIAWKRPVTS
jgi:outer membrane protein assembly factor BamB